MYLSYVCYLFYHNRLNVLLINFFAIFLDISIFIINTFYTFLRRTTFVPFYPFLSCGS